MPSHPLVVTAAPNSVTGSVCDHMAILWLASPEWRAVSAAFSCGSVASRKVSSSFIGGLLSRGRLASHRMEQALLEGAGGREVGDGRDERSRSAPCDDLGSPRQ